MTLDETNNILKILKGEYYNEFKDLSEEQLETKLVLWLDYFKNYAFNDILKITKELIKQKKFMPKISDYEELISDLRYYKEFGFCLPKTSSEAWGFMISWFVDNKDKEKDERVDNRQRFFELPEKIRKAIGGIDSYFKVVSDPYLSDRDFFNEKARFQRAYELLQKEERILNQKKGLLENLITNDLFLFQKDEVLELDNKEK
ncbi:MAG: hypothetical protein LBD41_01945 [Clostridiales Family XIII bacterium]|jgi:hypothetical protein|nr:hypothetical protein [Clostridiales Family XIII bacterium]